MIPPRKLAELIRYTVEELPYDKQQEVYDFATYLKNKAKNTEPKSGSGFQSMIGMLDGPSDLASNHDEIYD